MSINLKISHCLNEMDKLKDSESFYKLFEFGESSTLRSMCKSINIIERYSIKEKIVRI
jgi:hypothetical protein